MLKTALVRSAAPVSTILTVWSPMGRSTTVGYFVELPGTPTSSAAATHVPHNASRAVKIILLRVIGHPSFGQRSVHGHVPRGEAHAEREIYFQARFARERHNAGQGGDPAARTRAAVELLSM